MIDYFPKRLYPGLLKAANWALRAATVATIYGFYEFETNDVGVTEALKKIWAA